MAETLLGDITENGMNQGDLVKVLKNLRDVVNELQADHATNRALLAAVLAKLDTDTGVNDTDYASSTTLQPALTNSTAITLSKG